MEAHQLVLPGDDVLQIDLEEKSYDAILLGPGLHLVDDVIRATKPGILRKEGKPGKEIYYVDTHQKRYIAQKREFVIGTVLKKKGETYAVEIGGSEPASISLLAFENASKKTMKEMRPGDLLYGQLLVADKDMSPELVCIDIYNRAVGMGTLPEGGILFNVPLHVARHIIDPSNPLLITVAERINFTIAVGFNGRVWVKAREQVEMLAVMHAVSMLEVMSMAEAMKNVLPLVDSLLRKYGLDWCTKKSVKKSSSHFYS